MKNKRITFTRGGSKYRVGTPQIKYIEAAGEYILVHTADGNKHLRSGYLGKVNRQVGGVRIDKSTVVNETYLKGFCKTGKKVFCVLWDDTRKRVSRREARKLKRIINKRLLASS